MRYMIEVIPDDIVPEWCTYQVYQSCLLLFGWRRKGREFHTIGAALNYIKHLKKRRNK